MRTIQYNVSYEKMITRLPGLFAYLESDDFGNMVLHHAYDSNNGCYGKIVENIKLPYGLNVDGVDVLMSNETYTFRTIISNYYQYKDVLKENNEFKQFVERGIGKKEVPSEYKFYYAYVNKNNDKDVITEEEWDEIGDIREREKYARKQLMYTLIPDFVYLSNVKYLHDEMVKMRKQCDFYKDKKTVLGHDKHLCCLCDKYFQMGGEMFEEWLQECIAEAVEISDEYYNHADQENPMSLDFDIDLLSSYEDMGVIIPCISIWLPYKTYYVGDKVIHDNEVYVCINETKGKWDDQQEKVVFDNESFTKDRNILSICNNQGKVDPSIKSLDISGKTNSKLMDLRRFKAYLNSDNVGERPEDGYDWLFFYRKGYVCNITTINDDLGNIKDFISGETGTDKDNLAAFGDVIDEITADGENKTITFKYRLGVHLIATENATTYTDDDNNTFYSWKNFVVDNSNDYKKFGVKYEETYNYVIGGDLDKMINGELTVEYEKYNEGGETETVNEKICFDIDEDAEPPCEKSYINGDYDDGLKFYKFEFIKYNNTTSYDKMIANRNVNINSVLTDFSLKRTDNDEFMTEVPMIRSDYFNGISYSPTIKTNVRIQRGTTSVFDKHIRFGECKTIEDMIDYQNSSFFKISET